MAKKKKYYWLKLQKDFFKRHDTRIIESMENGKDYILFYLKLLVESIDHEGHLRFSESIPYNDKMLATITNTNVDIVRSAVKIFSELGLMQTLDDETLYMNDIENMIGSETEWAEKKRLQRESKKELEHKKEDNVQSVSLYSPNYENTLSDKSIETEYRVKNLELEEDYKEKNTKKEKPNYQTAESFKTKSLESLFVESVNYWNEKRERCEGMIRCRYTSTATIPSNKSIEIKKRFDLFTIEEIKESIDNLVKLWDRIDPQFRLSTYDSVMNNLEKWTNEANPELRYPKVEVTRKYRTAEERRYFTDAIRIGANEPEWLAQKKQECIDSLIAIGEEFIDYDNN